MSVWVQSRSGNEQAFKVDFTDGMDCADLKEVVTLKRNSLNLPRVVVHFIHSENSDEESFKLRAGAKVPIPTDGLGSSDDRPYFFSVAESQAGGVFVL